MGCGSFPAVDEVEVPCRATGLTSALPAEHREISGCLSGVLPPVSALGNPSGDGWNKAERSQHPFLRDASKTVDAPRSQASFS